MATATGSINVLVEGGSVMRTDRPLTNIQLEFWKDAKEKYEKYVKDIDVPDMAGMVLIVVALLNSLTFLFGRNYDKPAPPGEKRGTPELLNLARGYPWHLHNARPDFFRSLEEMFLLYRDILKHPDQNKLETELADRLNKVKVTKYMKNI